VKVTKQKQQKVLKKDKNFKPKNRIESKEEAEALKRLNFLKK
jgi:hypothetical protein